ncbi:hypothetical protein GX563_10540 [Candidatus Bathyarchaeota archaeon]|nr:hypothetical protein [Candidatus Bathyarchaeota archaeon]
MKYRMLHHQAKHIDRLIDENRHAAKAAFLTSDQLKTIVTTVYPDFYMESCGWHKIVFRNRLANHKVVLKVGPQRSIEADHSAYKRIPHSIRHRVFARLFWHTKYCLLQEYGEAAQVNAQELNEIRRAVYRYGVFDIKAENIKRINGMLKIIDANVAAVPVPTLMSLMDRLKAKLPEKLDELLKLAGKLGGN